jgi:hypothetical protein
MTFGRFFVGVLALLLVIVSIICIARFARRRLLPSWIGPPAWLADAVAAIGILVLAAEGLGVLGAFRPIPLVVLLGVGAACTVLVDRLRPLEPSESRPPASFGGQPRHEHWFERVGAVFAADWVPRTFHSYSVGMLGVDSLWYHGPVAANFVQTGHILPLYNIGNDNIVEFYPYSSELVHAVGMTLIGSDLLSPLVNVGWLALALFAGWCIGQRFGVASIAVVATAVAMGTTQIVGFNAGQNYNDVVGVALVVASVAVLVHSGYLSSLSSWKDLRAGWFAALAAGLAVGVKYTILIPVVALTVVFGVLAPSGVRLRAIAQWCVLVVVGGGLWYARNLIYAGNPIPNERVSLGFVTLPSPPAQPSVGLVHFLTSRSNWRTWFLPGLSSGLGRAWWAILALAAIGMIAGLVVPPSAWARILDPARRRATRRATLAHRRITPSHVLAARTLAVVGIAAVVGYLFTPEPNLPESFAYDVRFMILGILCGVLALTVTVSRRTPMAFLFLGILECALIGTQFAAGIWSVPPSPKIQSIAQSLSFGSPSQSAATFLVVFALGLAMTLRGVVSRNRQEIPNQAPGASKSWWRFVGAAGAIAAIGVVVLGGFSLQRYYLDHRYGNRLYPLDAWAENVHHARIGVDGNLILNYPLNGSDFTDSVTYITRHGPHGADYPITTCPAFAQTIDADHLEYVALVEDIVYISGKPVMTAGATAAAWLSAQPTRVVLKQTILDVTGVQTTVLYEIHGAMAPARCTRT